MKCYNSGKLGLEANLHHVLDIEKDESFDFGKLDIKEFKDLPKSFNVKVNFSFSVVAFCVLKLASL